ncbi:HAD-IC family P-type ATPase, partial [Candidatus Dependentiae bacterium]|nr:HAD-IC family P-type ATPase [Candidatus Dependentiae bacterium]
DIVLLQPGDVMCADMRLISSDRILVDESTMTGEAGLVEKNAIQSELLQENVSQAVVYAGSKIMAGTAAAIVVSVGEKTAFGQLIGITSKPGRLSSFSRGLNSFSIFVLYFVAVTLGLIFCMHLFMEGVSIDLGRYLIFYISLAVAVVPNALQVVINFALARSAAILARHKVLVKRFAALEDLGSMHVLCVGTLTENNLTVAEIGVCGDATKEEVLKAAMHSIARQESYLGIDPFDAALRSAWQAHYASPLDAIVLAQYPFDPLQKRNTTVVAWQGKQRVIVRGAFEAVLSSCPEQSLLIDPLIAWIKREENIGRRVLTIAVGDCNDVTHTPALTTLAHLSLLGALSFQDTIKHTAPTALAQARAMNIVVKMLTGDSVTVATQTARQLGFFDQHEEVISGSTYDMLSDDEKNAEVMRCNVFARVSPVQKHDIVMRLQRTLDVGFIGEGINDIPSLKAATVGITFHNASNAAKDAADIMLLERDLQVITEGIKQGRTVFSNTMKYLRVALSSNFSNFYTIAIMSLMNRNLPMLSVQLLAVNLLSDVPLLCIATDRVEDNEIKNPIHSRVKNLIIVTTLFGVICTFFDFFFFSMIYKEALPIFQSNWFIFSILSELALFFSIRTKKVFIFASRPSWPMILASVGTAVGCLVLPFTRLGQTALQLRPLTGQHIGFILTVIALNLMVVEVVKIFWYTYSSHVD